MTGIPELRGAGPLARLELRCGAITLAPPSERRDESFYSKFIVSRMFMKRAPPSTRGHGRRLYCALAWKSYHWPPLARSDVYDVQRQGSIDNCSTHRDRGVRSGRS